MSDENALKRVFEKIDALSSDVERLDRENKQLKNEIAATSKAGALNKFDTPSKEDVLELNVGGGVFHALRGTLTSIPSLLATKFNGDWDYKLPRDAHGRFYLDEDPEFFSSLLKYLREYNRMALPVAGGQSPVIPSFKDPTMTQGFIRFLESLHLTEHMYPMKLYKYDYTNLDQPNELGFLAGNWCDTQIVSQDNRYVYVFKNNNAVKRRIHSFEVECLEDNEDIQIGWIECDIDKYHPQADFEGSIIVLDVRRSHISIDERFGTVHNEIGVSFPKTGNLFIRTANYGAQWFVNETLIADTSEVCELLAEEGEWMSPWILPKGNFRIVKLEYDEIE
ncbi:hypothetical protein MPSEU_000306100 [Mayamaea pseudoterrestris]|nr:hypothetical protein MPSEU_000306100 [Mayamaea pseudoterrestris]